MADNQQAIAHAHNTLATVVNQTRIFSEQIVVKQHKLQTHLVQMDQAVRALADTLNKHTTPTQQSGADYATNTVSGAFVHPEKCTGHGPSVCVTGAEFGDTMQLYARGLLTHRRSPRRTL